MRVASSGGGHPSGCVFRLFRLLSVVTLCQVIPPDTKETNQQSTFITGDDGNPLRISDPLSSLKPMLVSRSLFLLYSLRECINHCPSFSFKGMVDD